MDREYFFKELEYLLSDLEEEEKEEALQYYRDYFEDAGTENEAELLKRLGSPEKVAAQIRFGLMEEAEDGGEYSERGFRDERFTEDQQIPDQYTAVAVGKEIRNDRTSTDDTNNKPVRTGKRRSFVWLLLIVIICLPLIGILCSIGFSVLLGVFGVGLGILGILVGLTAGGIGIIIGGIAGGIILIAAGVLNLSSPAVATMAFCLGCMNLAAAMLSLAMVRWGCSKAIPGTIRFGFSILIRLINWFVDTIRKMIDRFCGKGVRV